MKRSMRHDDPDALFERGNELDGLGRRDEAVAAWRRVVELEPGHAEAWFYLGVAAKERGEWQEAIALFDRAIALDPDEPSGPHCRGHMYQEIGDDARGRADLERAIAGYSEALAEDPDDAEPRFWRGAAYARLGDREAALADLEAAIDHDPDKREAAREEVDYQPLAADPKFIRLTEKPAPKSRARRGGKQKK